MGVISMILQGLERQFKAFLLFLWDIIGKAVAWEQDEHALPQKLIRAGQIVLAIMIFLLVLCAGGFVINNLLLKVIPASLMAIVFYIFITIFQWVPRRFARERDRKDMPWSIWQTMTKEQRDEWKHEYSREYALSMTVRGINGWLFWVVGILDLFILLEPWRAGNQLLVFGFLFLCWTFVHLFRFLGTLGVAIKIIFAIILVLIFAVRVGTQTNNELALRIAAWSHFKQSQSQIQRAAKDVFTEENKKEAGLIPQQRIYQLRQGAELVDRNGDKVSLTDNVAIVWVPDDKDQPIQPSILLGVYKQAYLPQSGSRTIFQRDVNCEVWVNFSDISRQIDLKIEPRARRQGDSHSRSLAKNVPTPPAKLTGQNMPEPKTPEQMPQYGGRVILTSSQELFNGLTLNDVAGSKIYWHRYGWTRHKDSTMDGWAPFLPCGEYSIEGVHRRVVKFDYGRVQFRRQDMPAYCVLACWQGKIMSWPEGFRGAFMTPIVLNPAIFGEESSVGIGVLNVPADVKSLVLKINAPIDRQLEWKSDQGSIVLEVVK